MEREIFCCYFRGFCVLNPIDKSAVCLFSSSPLAPFQCHSCNENWNTIPFKWNITIHAFGDSVFDWHPCEGQSGDGDRDEEWKKCSAFYCSSKVNCICKSTRNRYFWTDFNNCNNKMWLYKTLSKCEQNVYDSKSHSICIESFSWLTVQSHKSVTVTVHALHLKNSLHNCGPQLTLNFNMQIIKILHRITH